MASAQSDQSQVGSALSTVSVCPIRVRPGGQHLTRQPPMGPAVRPAPLLLVICCWLGCSSVVGCRDRRVVAVGEPTRVSMHRIAVCEPLCGPTIAFCPPRRHRGRHSWRSRPAHGHSKIVRLENVVHPCSALLCSSCLGVGYSLGHESPGVLHGWVAVPLVAQQPPQQIWGSSQARPACAHAVSQHRSTVPVAVAAAA